MVTSLYYLVGTVLNTELQAVYNNYWFYPHVPSGFQTISLFAGKAENNKRDFAKFILILIDPILLFFTNFCQILPTRHLYWTVNFFTARSYRDGSSNKIVYLFSVIGGASQLLWNSTELQPISRGRNRLDHRSNLYRVTRTTLLRQKRLSPGQ